MDRCGAPSRVDGPGWLERRGAGPGQQSLVRGSHGLAADGVGTPRHVAGRRSTALPFLAGSRVGTEGGRAVNGPAEGLAVPAGAPRAGPSGAGRASATTATRSAIWPPSRPSRSTSSARWPPSSSARSCSSRAGRTRSSWPTWRPKAFAPAALPFPVMHVDTGRNFPEVLEIRDRRPVELGARLVIAAVQDDIDAGRVVEEVGAGRFPQPPADHDPAPGYPGGRVRRRLRRRAPGGGEGPGEGADLQLPRRVRAVGPQGPAARNCGTSTTAATAGASTSGSFPSPTGPSSTSGSTSPTKRSRSRPSTSPITVRSFSATGCCMAVSEHLAPGPRRRGRPISHRPLPHGRRRRLHGVRSSRRPTPSSASSRRCR